MCEVLVTWVGIAINGWQLLLNSILINLSAKEFVAGGVMFMLKSPKR